MEIYGTLTLMGIHSPWNIGMLMRIAEVYKRRLVIWDQHGVFRDETSLRSVSDLSVGAFQRLDITFLKSGDIDELLGATAGRAVGTDSGSGASNVFDFQWQPTDNIILGNEYDGIGEDKLARLDETVKIPMPAGDHPKPRSFSPIDPDRTEPVARHGGPSLNVATAAAIVCATAYNQLAAQN